MKSSEINDKPQLDQLNIRINPSLNDWINDVVRQTKRFHGSKLPKEQLIEASIEYIKSLELDWSKIKTKEGLLMVLNPGKFNLIPVDIPAARTETVDKMEADQ